MVCVVRRGWMARKLPSFADEINNEKTTLHQLLKRWLPSLPSSHLPLTLPCSGVILCELVNALASGEGTRHHSFLTDIGMRMVE